MTFVYWKQSILHVICYLNKEKQNYDLFLDSEHFLLKMYSRVYYMYLRCFWGDNWFAIHGICINA